MPRGTGCDCTPYPPLTAKGLASTTGRGVKTSNDSVAGATTASVLEQLDSRSVIAHLRMAGVVEIEIGANDVAYSQSCGTRTACYEPRLPTLRKNLTAIVSRVHRSLPAATRWSCCSTTGACGSAASTQPQGVMPTSPRPTI